jgi:cytidylate kinase
MEGRDIGTVILPDADLKIFLQADPGIRANRRIKDGETDQITNRDEKDSTRKIAPLVPANGCIRIDTGILSIQEVTKSILDVIETLT